MEALVGLLTGFGVIMTAANLYLCFLGSLIGTLVGVLPGVGPLAALALLLPVTFNGIGTSQWAFYWFFSRVGVPVASGFALSVLFVALGIVGNLPGGVLYAWGRKES